MRTFLKKHAKAVRGTLVGFILLSAIVWYSFGGNAGGNTEDIPLPFGDQQQSTLRGSVAQIGTKNGISVTNVTFDAGEVSEPLAVDTIHFVLTPLSGVSNVALSNALTSGKRIFGYKYTSKDAALERQRRAEVVAGMSHTFGELFPGQFFTSDEQRMDGSFIPSFEMQNGISFLPLSQVTLTDNSRYIIIANDINTVVQVRNISLCGNSALDAGESCDDGNTTANDGCSATCQTEMQPGNLFVTKSNTPVRQQQLLGGTLGNEILRLQFAVDQEDTDVKTIVFTPVSGTNSDVDRLELSIPGISTPFATATTGACGTMPVPPSSFCAIIVQGTLTARTGQQSEVIVRPRMRTDADGAVSGQVIAYTVNSVSAEGVTSHGSLKQNNGDTTADGEVFIGTATAGPNTQIASSSNDVTFSKIVSVLNASPDFDGTFIPTGVAPVGQFKFTAASHTNTQNGLNKVVIANLYFNLDHQNIAFNGYSSDPAQSRFFIYNKANMTTKKACTVVPNADTTKDLVNCTGLDLAFNSGAVIASGQDITLVLEADIFDTKVDPAQASHLQVSLRDLNDPTAVIHLPNGTLSSTILWYDTDLGQLLMGFPWVDQTTSLVNSTYYGDSAICGNGSVEGTEECDDGNAVNDDSCDNSCHLVAAPF